MKNLHRSSSRVPKFRLHPHQAGLKSLLLGFLAVSSLCVVTAFATEDLSAPLTLEAVKQMARDQRGEIAAAKAKATAARERVAVVSALDDPMLMSSIDHYPFDDMEPSMAGPDAMETNQPTGRFDWSIALEQRFPLSRERTYRKRAAEADAFLRTAESDRVALEVEFEAIQAFWMLLEQRRMLDITRSQIVLARQLAESASARFAVAAGAQADVLRAEMELARLRSRERALAAQARGQESMLNMSIGREPLSPVPELILSGTPETLPELARAIESAHAHRPEFAMVNAEVDRARAELAIMRSMYRPMALVRIGSASTMAEGRGAMAMIGVSIPIWRGKLRAGVAEARAMEDMAQADLVAMRKMVEAEAIAAHAELIAAKDYLVTLTMEVAPRARLRLVPALAAYTSGTTSLASVIDAAQAQWMVEGELVMAQTQMGLAWARLERAIGQPLEILYAQP